MIPNIPEDGPDHFKEINSLVPPQLITYYYHFFCLLFLSIPTALFSYFQSNIFSFISHIFGTLLLIWLGTVCFLPQYFYEIKLHSMIQSSFQSVIQMLFVIWSYISCQFLVSDPYSCLPDSTHSNDHTITTTTIGEQNNSNSNNENIIQNESTNNANKSTKGKNGNNNNRNTSSNIELRRFDDDFENNQKQVEEEEENKQLEQNDNIESQRNKVERYQNKVIIDSQELHQELPLAFVSKYSNLNVSFISIYFLLCYFS